MRKKMIFIIALVMALLATFLFYKYTDQLAQEAVDQQQKVSVVAASVKIEKDKQIKAEMLKKMEVPAESVHTNATLDASSIIGKYARTTIVAGEVILDHHIQSLEEAAFLSGKIQQGYRAVTISGGKIETLVNMIEPEDIIDIIYTGAPLAEEDINLTTETETMVLQEKVRVLAVGRRMKGTDKFVEYDSITVEVEQEDALELIKASKKGGFNLILHGKMKAAEEKVEGS